MALAAVIDYSAARYSAMARQLLALGVPQDRIIATGDAAGLTELWTRERTIANLRRLTGHSRHLLEMWDTGELQEIERRTIAHLMGTENADPDRLIYSIGWGQPKTRRGRRAAQNRAWDIPA